MKRFTRVPYRVATLAVVISITLSVVLMVVVWGGGTSSPPRPSRVDTPASTTTASPQPQGPATDPIPVNPWAVTPEAILRYYQEHPGGR